MSRVVYNGVTLPLTRINDLSLEEVRSEDGIDYLYHRFTLDVSCKVTTDLPMFSDGPNPITAASTITKARNLLMQPRKTLLVYMGGQYDYPLGVTPAGVKLGGGLFVSGLTEDSATLLKIEGPDPAGGPFPETISVSNVIAGTSMDVRFKIVGAVRACTSGNEAVVVSNRYAVEFAYDENFYCTRSIRGKLVIKQGTDISGQFTADNFRQFCIPTLPAGYRRSSLVFSVSSDGLTLSYSIVDKEVFATAPKPATSVSAQYVEAMSDMGSVMTAGITVSLTGAVGTPRAALITLAGKIAASRYDENNGDIVNGFSVTEDLYNNQVTLALEIKKPAFKGADPKAFNPTAPELGTVFFQLSMLGQAVVFQNDPPADLSMRSNLLQAIVQAFATDPCSPDTDNPKSGSIGTILIGPAASNDVSQGTNSEFSKSPGLSNEHKSDVFTDYEISMEYCTVNNTLVAPVAVKEELETKSYESTWVPGAKAVRAKQAQSVTSLAGPTQIVNVEYTATRIGKPPLLPSAEQLSAGWQTLEHSYKALTPVLTSSQSFLFTVIGKMTVAAVRRLSETSDIPTGRILTQSTVPASMDYGASIYQLSNDQVATKLPGNVWQGGPFLFPAIQDSP